MVYLDTVLIVFYKKISTKYDRGGIGISLEMIKDESSSIFHVARMAWSMKGLAADRVGILGMWSVFHLSVLDPSQQ